MDLRPLLAALLAAPALAGCVTEDAACGLPEMAMRTPDAGWGHLATDPATPWDTLILPMGGEPGDRLAIDASAPPRWTAEVVPLGDAEPALRMLRVRPADGPAGTAAATWTLERSADGCRMGDSGTLRWSLDPPTPGEAARPGQGVHVHTAGFWENGTLFYTNIAGIDADAAWPRAPWYTWEGDAALPVYVYDESRDEEPLLWHPAAGTPIDGVLPLWGYFTTIPGFNEALKGLSTHTSRVVRIAPEDAYTRPGNEDHPLYGDALVFYIKVDKVVDMPCPADAAAASCRLPTPLRPQAEGDGAEGPGGPTVK